MSNTITYTEVSGSESGSELVSVSVTVLAPGSGSESSLKSEMGSDSV